VWCEENDSSETQAAAAFRSDSIGCDQEDHQGCDATTVNMAPPTARLSLIPTRWFSEDCRPKHQEDNVVIYGIAGLPRYRAGDVRRGAEGTWELWLTDATGLLRPAGVFDSPQAALHACATSDTAAIFDPPPK
jgi:hypothetical protein